MRKLFAPTKNKSKAQAMVEFALVLPILLLLIYGLMELGRLLFIYASTISAARQAARYGAATGTSPNGMPYYQDCIGIQNAANQLGFIQRFANVTISYDGGVLDSNNDGLISANEAVPLNPADPACNDPSFVAQNGDRIKVSVTSQWTPITPLVPLQPFTLTSTSERTILASVDIAVTGMPADFPGTGGTPTLTMTAYPTTYDKAGQVINFTYVVTNTGDGDLVATFNVTDPTGKVTNITCQGQPVTGRLEPGQTFTCTGTYAVQQADLNAGFITSTGSSTPAGPTIESTTKVVSVYADQKAALSLDKSPSKTATITTVTYTYELTNTGNVTLSGDNESLFTITDNKLGPICSGGSRNDPDNLSAPTVAMQIDPDETVICKATHAITPAEIEEGTLTNVAVATAYYQQYDPVTKTKTLMTVNASDEVTIITSPLALYVTGTLNQGSAPYLTQQITYEFSVQNVGSADVNLTGIAVKYFNGHGAVPTIPCSGTIAPDQTLKCPLVYYNVTQEDLDSAVNGQGDPILISAAATANAGATVYTGIKNLYPVELKRTPTLAIKADTSAIENGVLSATPMTVNGYPVTVAVTKTVGNVVNYTYTIMNTGNVTLYPPLGGFSVTDTQIINEVLCDAPDDPIAPLGSKVCTSTREILDADIKKGSIIGVIESVAMFGSNTYTGSGKSMTLTSTSPALTLEITSPVSSVVGAGVPIRYSYILTNTGNADISAVLDSTPYDFVTGSLKGTYPSCTDGTLAIGESTTCTGTYITKSSDKGFDVVNITRAYAYTALGGQVPSNEATLVVAVTTPTYCSLSHGPLKVETINGIKTFGMTISNNNEYSVDVSGVNIIYNDDPSNQQITQLMLGAGNVLWEKDNQKMDGSYYFPLGLFTGNYTIAPGAADVKFYISGWKTGYNVGGMEHITIEFSDESCPDLISDQPSVTPSADMKITKDDGTDSVDTNSVTTYVVRVSNEPGSTSSIQNAKISDPVASGMTKLSVTCHPTDPGVCLTAPAIPQLESGSFVLPVLTPGQYYTLEVKAKITGTAGTTITNIAAITMPLGATDTNPTNNTATDINTVMMPKADLLVTKDDEQDTVYSGARTVYKIRVTNNGPSTIVGAKLRDAATPTLTKVTSITCSGDPGKCVTPPNISQIEYGYTLPTLEAGQHYEILVPARVIAASGGTASNTALVTMPTGAEDSNIGNNTATDNNSVSSPVADLSITKDNGLSGVSTNSEVAYTIRVSNSVGPSAITGAILTDPPASNLTKLSAACSAAAGNVCSGTVSIANLEAGGVTLPMIDVGKFYEVNVTVRVNALSGTVSNTAYVATPPSASDPDTSNNESTDSDSVLSSAANLSITKSNGVTNVNTGGTTSYTIVVSNAGPTAASNSTFKDPQVTGLDVTNVTCGSPTGGAVCPAVSVSAMQNAGINIATLPSGGSLTFTVTGTMSATSGSVTNTATISAPSGITDPDLGNNSASDTDTINLRADLEISKTDNATSMLAGATTNYTVVIKNNGPSPAHNALFKDPAISGLGITGVSCDSASGGAACPNLGDVTVAALQGDGIALPTFPSGGILTFTVTGSATGATSSVANTATITAPIGVTDPTPGNNTSTDPANSVSAAANLGITKSDGTDTVGSGGTTLYNIVISNYGPSAANNAIFKDPYVAGFNVTSVTCHTPTNGASCPTVANTTKANMQGTGGIIIPSLPNNSSVTFTVGGDVTSAPGTFINTATVTAPSGVTDPYTDNNTATDTNTVRLDTNLVITKTNNTTTVYTGTETTYQIKVTNNGPSAANNAVFKDPASSDINMTSISCGSASGGAVCPAVSVAAMQSASGITIATLPSGGSLTFTVTGTVQAAGGSTLANTATIAPPAGAVDPDNDNNTATDSDEVRNAAVCTPTNLTTTFTAGLVSSGISTSTLVINNNTGEPLTLKTLTVLFVGGTGSNAPKLTSIVMTSPTPSINLATGLSAASPYLYTYTTGTLPVINSGVPATITITIDAKAKPLTSVTVNNITFQPPNNTTACNRP